LSDCRADFVSKLTPSNNRRVGLDAMIYHVVSAGLFVSPGILVADERPSTNVEEAMSRNVIRLEQPHPRYQLAKFDES